MKVKLDKSFPVAASPERAWAFLRDVESVAACMPGAELTERLDDTHYRGIVKVRLGPAALTFKGELAVQEVSPETRSLRLVGRGTDTSGSSVASMDLLARVDATDEGSSTLVGSSEVSMSGKAAAFGARMMNSVADQIFRQFADNFMSAVAALEEAGATAGAGTTGSTGAGKSRELNAFVLLWAVIRDWFRNLFSKKAA